MTKQQLKDKCEKAIAWLEENSRSYDYRTVYCVNVKRYGDQTDVEELARAYSDRIAKRIIEEFDDERVYAIYNDWLEYEGRYFIEDFLTGCTINSAKHYQELRELVQDGKPTIYPYIDRRLSIKSKLTLIDLWDKKDRKIERYLNRLDVKSAGLYGRSGGWFGIKSAIADDLDGVISAIVDGYTMSEIYASHDIAGIFEEFEAIQWVLDEADKYNKGLSFEEELKYRIEEFAEEVKTELQREKEIKIAKTFAGKYGLILATAV